MNERHERARLKRQRRRGRNTKTPAEGANPTRAFMKSYVKAVMRKARRWWVLPDFEAPGEPVIESKEP